MRFRPCIDIHNGKVKQIVGKTLQDEGSKARENFAAERDAEYYAKLYREDGLAGGHVIMLNPAGSPYFAATKAQALQALLAYPGGLELGGGVNPDNAAGYLKAGASHVIVTSYVFSDGQIRWENLEKLRKAVGRENIVLDLSCARKEDAPECERYVVTDRWQKFTQVKVSVQLLEELAAYCDEFLVHGVDVEGERSGVDQTLVRLLAAYAEEEGSLPVTYAGGIGSLHDLEQFEKLTGGTLDFTIGSALDLFGGDLSYKEVIRFSENDVKRL